MTWEGENVPTCNPFLQAHSLHYPKILREVHPKVKARPRNAKEVLQCVWEK